MSGWEYIDEALRERGHGRFLRQGTDISGDQTLALVDQIATRLAAFGIREGEVVPVMTERDTACVLCLLALWRHGAVAYPLPAREPDDVLVRRANHVGARLMISSRELEAFAGTQITPQALAGRTDIDASPIPDGDPTLLPGAATLLSTSGSSGNPKLVVHELRQHIASAVGALRALRLEPQDTWLMSLPMYHVGGLAPLFRGIASGAALAIPKGQADVQDALVHYKPSHVSLVATQLVRMLGHDPCAHALGACKMVLAGGGPLPVPLRRWALGRGVPLMVSYGATETASLVSVEREPLRLLEEGNAGLPLSGRSVCVDVDGEVLVGGKTVMNGYLVDRRVEDPRGEDPMLAMGDLGKIDATGRLFITGRADNMFVSGGENIHPEEIERAVLREPGVAEAVVVPIPHPEFGARPAAFIRCQPGAETTEFLLRKRLARELPAYKIPDHFWLLPEASPGSFKRDRKLLENLAADPDQAQLDAF